MMRNFETFSNQPKRAKCRHNMLCASVLTAPTPKTQTPEKGFKWFQNSTPKPLGEPLPLPPIRNPQPVLSEGEGSTIHNIRQGHWSLVTCALLRKTSPFPLS
jgi:hypothetical protein